MPTYEYACRSCGEHLEKVQSFSDDALTTCPACGGELRKVFGSVGIVFKGSGFYKTDSRSTSTASKSAGGGTDGERAATAPSSATNGNSTSADGAKGNSANGDAAKAPSSPASESAPAKSPAASSSGSSTATP
ncbi:MAG: regulatory protein FmdB family [Acidimicrobiaceae bacterium]|nr:regulatory protein FmdB family [Acidimicrobiaceae bacterium]